MGITKNFRFEEISITVTTDQTLISGSERLRSSVNEIIQQGSDWSILAFTRNGELSSSGIKKLKSLLAILIWMKSGKTRALREIKKLINNKLWKEEF